MDPASDVLAVRRALAPLSTGTLIVLFGSRARGDASVSSDWDIGYVGEIDPEALRVALSRALSTDAIDVVDLARAGALLRYRAARDGAALHEPSVGAFDEFRVQASTFFCDIEPVLRRAYDGVLEGLGR